MHDLTRDIASERISVAQRMDSEFRPAKFYLAYAAQANKLYLSGHDELIAALNLFDLERQNIRAGQNWAAMHKSENQDIATLVIQYAVRPAHLLALRQPASEQIEWMLRALQSSQFIGDRIGECSTLGQSCKCLEEEWRSRKSHKSLRRTVAIAQSISDSELECHALCGIGLCKQRMGHFYEAVGYFERNLMIAFETGDIRSAELAYGNLGNCWFHLGWSKRCNKYYLRQLRISDMIGDPIIEGNAPGDLRQPRGFAALSVELRAFGLTGQLSGVWADCSG